MAEAPAKPTARSQNTDAKLLIYRLFQEGRVLAQDGMAAYLSFRIGSLATRTPVTARSGAHQK